MNGSDYADAALVVLGHGTTLNPGSALPVRQHAAELGRRKVFATVQAAFWKQEPRLPAVLAAVSAPRVFIVPLFISEGYFSSEIIPQELGFDGRSVRHLPGQTQFYCQPLGTHDAMIDVILARAEEVVQQHPFPRAPKPQDLTLFIAGHGTGRNAQSRQAITRSAALLRARNL
jgi:sirohydrochlorin cobaltochelatase